MIKLSRPHISKEAMEEVCKVLESGMLVQGEKVLEFESKLKQFINVDYVSAVSSGTAALHLALETLKIGEGDAVLVPNFTFVATANVVELQKARTVLVDVDSTTYNMCPEKLEQTIVNYNGQEKLKAIIVVHEFGAPANMTKIIEIAKKYNLFVIEDAACALGTYHNGQHVGTFGDIGCFSFHPRKSITTGEGGAIITNNENLNLEVNILRNHGLQKNKEGITSVVFPGFNYRMTDFQAVLGTSQLKEFDQNLLKRKQLINEYFKQLENNDNLKLPANLEGHAWQTFMVVINPKFNRNNIINELKKRNIETNMGAQALNDQDYYREKYKKEILRDNYQISLNLYYSGLALPLHTSLDMKDVHYVSQTLIEIINRMEVNSEL